VSNHSSPSFWSITLRGASDAVSLYFAPLSSALRRNREIESIPATDDEVKAILDNTAYEKLSRELIMMLDRNPQLGQLVVEALKAARPTRQQKKLLDEIEHLIKVRDILSKLPPVQVPADLTLRLRVLTSEERERLQDRGQYEIAFRNIWNGISRCFVGVTDEEAKRALELVLRLAQSY
jgi:hypothetical protein